MVKPTDRIDPSRGETVSASDTRVRKIHTMNEPWDAVRWPTASPTTLSEDARTLYGDSSSKSLDRDWFAPRATHKYVSQSEADAYEVTERDLAAIEQIEEAGLGQFYPRDRTLHLVPVHPNYTVAEGRGSQLIRVYLKHHLSGERKLLAVIVGGDLESRDARSGSAPQIDIRARHETATDIEHDASSTAVLHVVNPTIPNFRAYGHSDLTGVLVEARLYPIGVDPLTQSDRDTNTRELCEVCEDRHPFAPYQPSRIEGLTGLHLVEIEWVPLRPYLVAGV